MDCVGTYLRFSQRFLSLSTASVFESATGFCPHQSASFSYCIDLKGVFALLAVFTLKNRDFCDCQDARHSGRLAADIPLKNLDKASDSC